MALASSSEFFSLCSRSFSSIRPLLEQWCNRSNTQTTLQQEDPSGVFGGEQSKRDSVTSHEEPSRMRETKGGQGWAESEVVCMFFQIWAKSVAKFQQKFLRTSAPATSRESGCNKSQKKILLYFPQAPKDNPFTARLWELAGPTFLLTSEWLLLWEDPHCCVETLLRIGILERKQTCTPEGRGLVKLSGQVSAVRFCNTLVLCFSKKSQAVGMP